MSVSQVLSGTPAGVTLAPTGPDGSVTVRTTQATDSLTGFILESAVPTADTSLYIQSTGTDGHSNQYRWVVGGETDDGLIEGSLQLFSYQDGAVDAQYLQTGPVQSATEGIIYGRWGMLNPNRAGTIPALGAGPNVVACDTITASSQVILSLVGTNNPGGLAAYAVAIPAPAITKNPGGPGANFTVTATAAHVGLIYNYIVFG